MFDRRRGPTVRWVTDRAPETPRIDSAAVIEEVARVKGRVAHEFEGAAVHEVVSGFRDDVGESGGSMTDVGRHNAGAGLHFLNRIDVEVRKCSAAEFRVGRIDSIRRKNGSDTALAV